MHRCINLATPLLEMVIPLPSNAAAIAGGLYRRVHRYKILNLVYSLNTIFAMAFYKMPPFLASNAYKTLTERQKRSCKTVNLYRWNAPGNGNTMVQ